MTFQQHAITFRPLGDAAVVVQLGSGMDPSTHTIVTQLISLIEHEPFEGFIEAVPSYNSVTVYYAPLAVCPTYAMQRTKSPYDVVKNYMLHLCLQIDHHITPTHRVIEIPVVYGGEYGPDLAHVASSNGLSIDEVIDIHCTATYLVYMIGFAPGFPFMGGMDERIATPRKHTPRLSIPVGSVGIAGKQTGVYPMETPGGWQIIGRTPLPLFLPNHFPPTLLQSGDEVRFVPISAEQFAHDEEMKR